MIDGLTLPAWTSNLITKLMKNRTWSILFACFALLLLIPLHLSARPRSPLPPLPESGVLWQWRCDEAGAWFPLRSAPLEAANADFAESWSGYALRMSSLTPALLRFPVVDTDGRTNLNCQVGSMRFWFKPDWSSQSLGGQGPGTWARLIEVGAFTDDARFGWWSLHLSPEGDAIHFRAQAGGKTVEYLRAGIAWAQGQWHEIALTYDARSTVIYLDGKAVAQGAGVTLAPSAKPQADLGFEIGSDMAGENLAQGEFDELKTYRHPLAPAQVAWIYECNARQAALGPVSAEEEQMQLLTVQALRSGQMMALSSPPPPPGDPPPGDPSTNILWSGTNSFNSTNLHLGPPFWTNGNLLMSYGGGSTNRPPYDLFLATNIPPVALTNNPPPMGWEWVYRTATSQTNWTLYAVPPEQSFFLLAGTNDWDADEMTDAYERLVSQTATNVAQPSFRVFITLPDNASILP